MSVARTRGCMTVESGSLILLPGSGSPTASSISTICAITLLVRSLRGRADQGSFAVDALGLEEGV
jgi:hypothetical protein